MSAEQYDPSQITMTIDARRHVAKQLARENAQGLRLGVTESGCNGHMYELDYLATLPPSDTRRFEFDDGVVVFVAEADWPLVAGTEIDYVTEGLNSALKFKNPNAESQCGCGESFSLAAEAG